MFKEIDDKLNNKYGEVFYAINKQPETQNNEYCVHTKDSVRFLDFYIPLIIKSIEFDGDYWHGPIRGNIKREEKREEDIKEAIPNIKTLHIKESEYTLNPEQTILKCLDFLNNN